VALSLCDVLVVLTVALSLCDVLVVLTVALSLCDVLAMYFVIVTGDMCKMLVKEGATGVS